MSKEWLTTAIALLLAAQGDWDGGNALSRDLANDALRSAREALNALKDEEGK